MNSITIKEPSTEKEFNAYFKVRFEVLRKPWDHPPGSEKDQDDPASFHAMAMDANNEIQGVCRLHFNSDKEAQIRFMAVKDDMQGKGVGRKLMEFMESNAKEKGASTMILHARENAVDFYKRCGYQLVETSYLLWGEIQHFLMSKSL